jgi:hypothetical protein
MKVSLRLIYGEYADGVMEDEVFTLRGCRCDGGWGIYTLRRPLSKWQHDWAKQYLKIIVLGGPQRSPWPSMFPSELAFAAKLHGGC